MYSMHRVVVAPSEKNRFEEMLPKLSRELVGVPLTPIYDEDGTVVEYELSGFLPDSVVEMLEDEKKLTKRLKDKGDNDSEAKNKSFIKKIKKSKKPENGAFEDRGPGKYAGESRIRGRRGVI